MVGRYCAKNFTDMKLFNIHYIFWVFSVTLKFQLLVGKMFKTVSSCHGGTMCNFYLCVPLLSSYPSLLTTPDSTLDIAYTQ